MKFIKVMPLIAFVAVLSTSAINRFNAQPLEVESVLPESKALYAEIWSHSETRKRVALGEIGKVPALSSKITSAKRPALRLNR